MRSAAVRHLSPRRHPVASGFLALLLIVVVAFGVCEWRGWPFLRQPLQDFLAKHLDRPVQVGEDFDLHLLRAVRVRTDRLAIGPPRWADPSRGNRFVDAHGVDLRLPWSTVWNLAVTHKPVPIQVSSLEVGSLDAVLWRQADGRADWTFDLPKTSGGPTRVPEFERLVVHDGRLTLDDAPTKLALHAQASTVEGSDANGRDSGLRITGGGRFREGDFDFTMHSNGVLPLVAPEGSQVSVPVTLQAKAPEGRLRFEGQARDVVHLQALDGRFELSGSSLAKVGAPFGITLPTTARFDAEGKLAKDGQVWKAAFARFEVGGSLLAGDFAFDRRPQVPLLTGTLRGRNLDLVDLGPAFGTPAPGAANPPKPPGKLFPSREFDIPSLLRMNADVAVDLQKLDLHTAVLEPFVPIRARIHLQDGMLALDRIQARTSGGELQGKLGLDGRNVKQPHWSGDLRVAGVQLEQWLKIRDTHMKPHATEAMGKEPAAHYLTGRLGGRVTFTGGGRSVASMMGSLDGTVSAWVNDGKVSHLALEAAGIDVAQALGVLVRGDDALPMQCAVAQFTARDGLLHTDVGILDNKDTTMIFNGDISLAQEHLDLVARANPKDFSPAALRAPVHVEGPFVHPHVRLEAKPIATKAVAALALGALNPLAALIPLMDPGSKAPYGCQQAMEQLRGTRAPGVEPPKVQTSGTSQAKPVSIRPPSRPLPPPQQRPANTP